jgi:hypothetical protein
VGEALVTWDAGTDRSSSTGTPGSGIARQRLAFRLAGGDWSPWSPATGDEELVVPEVTAGHKLDVEVRSIDAVGNASPVTAATLDIRLTESCRTAPRASASSTSRRTRLGTRRNPILDLPDAPASAEAAAPSPEETVPSQVPTASRPELHRLSDARRAADDVQRWRRHGHRAGRKSSDQRVLRGLLPRRYRPTLLGADGEDDVRIHVRAFFTCPVLLPRKTRSSFASA